MLGRILIFVGCVHLLMKRLGIRLYKLDIKIGSTCSLLEKKIKPIKLRVKGGQPAMPHGAS